MREKPKERTSRLRPLFGTEFKLERFGQIVPRPRQFEIAFAAVGSARGCVDRKAGALTVLRNPLFNGEARQSCHNNQKTPYTYEQFIL